MADGGGTRTDAQIRTFLIADVRGSTVFTQERGDEAALASAGLDGMVRVWALELDDLIAIARAKVTRALTDEACRRYLHRACPEP